MEIENIMSAFLPNPQKGDLSVPAKSKHSLHNTHQEQTAAVTYKSATVWLFHARNLKNSEGSPSIILAAYYFKIFKTISDKDNASLLRKKRKKTKPHQRNSHTTS